MVCKNVEYEMSFETSVIYITGCSLSSDLKNPFILEISRSAFFLSTLDGCNCTLNNQGTNYWMKSISEKVYSVEMNIYEQEHYLIFVGSSIKNPDFKVAMHKCRTRNGKLNLPPLQIRMAHTPNVPLPTSVAPLGDRSVLACQHTDHLL